MLWNIAMIYVGHVGLLDNALPGFTCAGSGALDPKVAEYLNKKKMA
jgi:hypothetical protein